MKNWNTETENKITKKWKDSEQFKFNPKTKKPIYSIDTPPPYINSPIHIGHATIYSYMDFFARYKRMKGFEVLFPLGLDRNGLPIEIGAEKKYKISAFKLPRQEFLNYCKKLLEETSAESTNTFVKLGISFNSYKQGKEIGSVYLNDHPDYRKITQQTFIELYKKGQIYEGKRINNWDPKLRTTIADSEIEYKEIKSQFNHIKWKVKGTKEEIIIATTRPELISSCGMIIFNPEDKRYKHLEGKTAISPIFKKEIPIKPHTLAQIDKGSGLVMMCSAGDLTDIQFFREMKLKPVISINIDGTMNENAGLLKGLKIKEARKKIINTLKEKNLIKKQEEITHRTPISERSKAEIEFIEMPEFYLKQLKIKNKIKEQSKKIKFYPESARKILNDWINSISIDWPISRRRFYATEVPLWYSEDKELIAIPQPGKYYQPWKEEVPKNAEVLKNNKIIGKVENFKNIKWKGEEKVLDTWFDSSISELYIIDLKDNLYPITLRPQGKEIIRTWLYYTLLRGYLKKEKMPFKEVWIHNHILDNKGKKMSKSIGNVINPQEIIKEHGAESFRLWAATEGDISKQDMMCSKERIKAELKTINKIINVSKFVMMFDKPKKPKLEKLDELIIEHIKGLTNYAEQHYEKYDFYNPSNKLRHFLWEIFASNYIELIKPRAYNNQNKFSKEENTSAKYTLHFLLERFLTLIYPIIPQVTTTIAKEKNIDLLNIQWPEEDKELEEAKISELISFNKKIWKMKKEKNISLRDEISNIEIPKELKDFEKDLINCHNIKQN